MEDPGQINEYLAKSLISLDQATQTYAKKRLDMYAELTTSQALDYHSRKDGSLAVEAPDNVIELIKSIDKKIGELGEEGREGIALSSLNSIDNYKIHGDLYNRVQRSIAEKSLRKASLSLEELAKKEAESQK